MPSALIFAAGNGERWYDGKPKQLAEVDGEAVLHRTVRQLKERGVAPIVIVTNTAGVLGHKDAEIFRPPASRFLVETILSTKPLWKGDTIGLLGDVFFSDAAMDTIVARSGELHWYGRAGASPLTGTGCGEPFAMTWTADTAERFEAANEAGLEAALATGALRDSAGSPIGTPWQPYRWLEGLPLDQHVVKQEKDGGIWVQIDDWTDDFDTVQRYQMFLYRYNRRFLTPARP